MLPVLVVVLAGVTSAVALQAGDASAAGARDLAARVQCSQDVLKVTFSWQPGGSGQQWLDLSITDAGFAPGTFTGTGPISASRSSITWDTAAPNTTYYARINTFDNNTWTPSTTLTVTTPACGAPPLAPVTIPATAPVTGSMPNAAMLALQASLEQHIAAAPFETAVAVTDLQTGETISVNGNRQQLAGCVMNLLAIMQAVIDLQNGLYDESLVGDLIFQTIYGSNPVTARDILHIMDNGDIPASQRRINALIDYIGLTGTFYDHPPAYWPAYSLAGRSNLTTALDMNRALAAFWNGSIMSFEWRDYLYAKLQGVKPGLNYLIPAGVGDGVTGHKNGFLWVTTGWVDNDTGIVTFQRNGQTYAYAITFLTQGVHDKYADIPLGQTVSSLVWQYFDSRY